MLPWRHGPRIHCYRCDTDDGCGRKLCCESVAEWTLHQLLCLALGPGWAAVAAAVKPSPRLDHPSAGTLAPQAAADWTKKRRADKQNAGNPQWSYAVYAIVSLISGPILGFSILCNIEKLGMEWGRGYAESTSAFWHRKEQTKWL